MLCGKKEKRIKASVNLHECHRIITETGLYQI